MRVQRLYGNFRGIQRNSAKLWPQRKPAKHSKRKKHQAALKEEKVVHSNPIYGCSNGNATAQLN
jgi:hypothetical protein